jgi:hypothetical protein
MEAGLQRSELGFPVVQFGVQDSPNGQNTRTA